MWLTLLLLLSILSLFVVTIICEPFLRILFREIAVCQKIESEVGYSTDLELFLIS